MITLDFSWAVCAYAIFSLSIIVFIWMAERAGKERNLSLDPKFIWHCSICTYTYINTKEDSLSTCPRCGSYNKKSLT